MLTFGSPGKKFENPWYSPWNYKLFAHIHLVTYLKKDKSLSVLGTSLSMIRKLFCISPGLSVSKCCLSANIWNKKSLLILILMLYARTSYIKQDWETQNNKEKHIIFLLINVFNHKFATNAPFSWMSRFCERFQSTHGTDGKYYEEVLHCSYFETYIIYNTLSHLENDHDVTEHGKEKTL